MSFGLADLENLGAQPVQLAVAGQLLHRALLLVVGVDLDQRLGPVAAVGIALFDRLPNVVRTNTHETARESAVFVDQTVAEGKNIFHFGQPSGCFLCVPEAARHPAQSYFPKSMEF